MSSRELLSDELLSQIKGIQIKAKSLVNDVFAGEYLSAFKGRGMEFEEVREYFPGDDVRNIDWNVTARSEKPYIKTFRDERELTVFFVVDVSGSTQFGSNEKLKKEVMAEITAMLAYAAMKNNDKVGLLIFSDHNEHFIPPKKGRGHIWRIIKEILTYEAKSHKTNIKIPLEFLARVQKKKCITFLISDFLIDEMEKPILSLSRKHELVAISINDQREFEIPAVGYIELEDAETGENILVNTRSEKFLKNYASMCEKKYQEQQSFFDRHGIDYVNLNTSENYFELVAKYFKNRDKIRRRR